jgi:hypothetical protein
MPTRKSGVDSKLASLQATVTAHTEEDTRRFNEVAEKLDSIATDVKSLLESRSFQRGAWKMVVYTSTAISTLVGLLIAYVKGH